MPDLHWVHNAVAIPVVSTLCGTIETLKFGMYNADGSLCLPALHWREADAPSQSGDLPTDVDRNTLPILPRGLYGGIFFDHFGHFLTESIGRLWAACAPDTCLADLPIYVFEPWNRIDLGNEDYFVAQILRRLGVDLGRIVPIEHPVTISELIVPEQKYGLHLLARPPKEFLRFLLKSQRRIEPEAGDMAGLPRKVYVSRALLDPSRGKVVGEEEFERFLEQSGYHIFHPQEHRLSRQLHVYLNAEKLIFCEGSALHACILLPRLRAKLAIILRRRASRIALQFSGYGQQVSLIRSILSERSLGLPEWHGVTTIDYWECSRLLCEGGFIHGHFDQWPAMAETQEREALAAYVRTIAADKRFLSFLLEADSAEAAEASLMALLGSRSWRITAPLRLARRLLTRIRATPT
jgi:hypothetical protein